ALNVEAQLSGGGSVAKIYVMTGGVENQVEMTGKIGTFVRGETTRDAGTANQTTRGTIDFYDDVNGKQSGFSFTFGSKGLSTIASTANERGVRESKTYSLTEIANYKGPDTNTSRVR
ncbi:MAG: hypothetical protein EB060_08715, partial [Proteobacteria bacterium]|nr:hypothetical protein [Pseudomonadota bacterium]